MSEHSSPNKEGTPVTDFATADFGIANSDYIKNIYVVASSPEKSSSILKTDDSPEKPLAEPTIP